jgi:hypothetical protein
MKSAGTVPVLVVGFAVVPVSAIALTSLRLQAAVANVGIAARICKARLRFIAVEA